MKRYGLLVLASVFMFSIALSAQGQTPANGAGFPKKEFRHVHRGLITPQKRADKMAQQLGLTDAEKAKVKELFEKQDAARIKMADEVYKAKQEFKTKFENARKANQADLQNIIGKEKFEKLEALHADQMKKMKEHMAKMRNHSFAPGVNCPANKMKM